MPENNTPRYGERRSTRTVTCACSPSSSACCFYSSPSPSFGCLRSSRPGRSSFGWMKSAGPKPWPMRRSRPRPIPATPPPSISSTAFSMTISDGAGRRPGILAAQPPFSQHRSGQRGLHRQQRGNRPAGRRDHPRRTPGRKCHPSDSGQSGRAARSGRRLRPRPDPAGAPGIPGTMDGHDAVCFHADHTH